MVPFSIIFVGEFCVTIYTQQQENAGLLERDLETLFTQEEKTSKNQNSKEIPEEKDRANRYTFVHQRHGEKRIKSICNAGNDSGRIPYQGISAESLHMNRVTMPAITAAITGYTTRVPNHLRITTFLGI